MVVCVFPSIWASDSLKFIWRGTWEPPCVPHSKHKIWNPFGGYHFVNPREYMETTHMLVVEQYTYFLRNNPHGNKLEKPRRKKERKLIVAFLYWRECEPINLCFDHVRPRYVMAFQVSWNMKICPLFFHFWVGPMRLGHSPLRHIGLKVFIFYMQPTSPRIWNVLLVHDG